MALPPSGTKIGPQVAIGTNLSLSGGVLNATATAGPTGPTGPAGAGGPTGPTGPTGGSGTTMYDSATTLTFSTTGGDPSGGGGTNWFPSQSLTFTAGIWYRVDLKLRLDAGNGDSSYIRAAIGDGSTRAESFEVHASSGTHGLIRISHYEGGAESIIAQATGDSLGASGNMFYATSGKPIGELWLTMKFLAQDTSNPGPFGGSVNGDIGFVGNHGAVPLFGTGTWYVWIQPGTVAGVTVRSGIVYENPRW